MKIQFIIVLCLFSCCAFSQSFEETNIDPLSYLDNIEVMDKTEYLIPSAPAFALLGVTPELVNRSGVVRDFKVDWRIKNYQVAPDLALEAQPFWLLYYNKKSLKKYNESSAFMQMLSTTSVSFGTAKLDGVNHFGYALKLTVFREKDPMKDKNLMQELIDEETMIYAEIDSLIGLKKDSLVGVADKERIKILNAQIKMYEFQKKDKREEIRSRMQEIAQAHVNANWNASSLDVAFGRVYTFNNNAEDSIFLIKAGYAFWANGGLRLGRRGLLGGLVRLKSIGGTVESMVGVNLRHGGSRFSFYGEMMIETKYDRDITLINPDDPFANKFSEDLGVSWLSPIENVQKDRTYTLAYGGDFKLSRSILLNFALRTQFGSDFSFNKLIPVANLTCLMR